MESLAQRSSTVIQNGHRRNVERTAEGELIENFESILMSGRTGGLVRINPKEFFPRFPLPSCQRAFRPSAKKRAEVLEEMIRTGRIPGQILLGTINGTDLYLVDGQHREIICLDAGIETILAEVRVRRFANMDELVKEYIRCNSKIASHTSGDQLKALVTLYPTTLGFISKKCSFVSFSSRRIDGGKANVNFSMCISAWTHSKRNKPTDGGFGKVEDMARDLTPADAAQLAEFLKLAHDAWGREPAIATLWGNLNLTLCMWLYRRVVLAATVAPSRRKKAVTQVTPVQFRNALMELVGYNKGNYVAILRNRTLSNDADNTYEKYLCDPLRARWRNDGVGDVWLPKELG